MDLPIPDSTCRSAGPLDGRALATRIAARRQRPVAWIQHRHHGTQAVGAGHRGGSGTQPRVVRAVAGRHRDHPSGDAAVRPFQRRRASATGILPRRVCATDPVGRGRSGIVRGNSESSGIGAGARLGRFRNAAAHARWWTPERPRHGPDCDQPGAVDLLLCLARHHGTQAGRSADPSAGGPPGRLARRHPGVARHRRRAIHESVRGGTNGTALCPGPLAAAVPGPAHSLAPGVAGGHPRGDRPR